MGKKTKTICVSIAASLVIVIATPFLVGFLLPREHQAIVEGSIDASCEAVFEFAVNISGWPNWRTNVDSVKHFSDGSFRATVTGGGDEIDYEFDADYESLKMVARIITEDLPFGGQWTIEVEADPPKMCKLIVTEDGFVDPPVWRFVGRFFFGHESSAQAYISDVQAHCIGGKCQGAE